MTKAETNANEYLRIYFELNAQYETYVESLRIPYSILPALRITLEYNGDCTQRTICEYTSLLKQTVNVIVATLLCHRVIRIVELGSNRGHKAIHLIDKRWVFALEVVQRMKNAGSKAMESLDENQKETILTAAKLYVARFRDHLLE